MQEKFKREFSFGKERFRGLAVWDKNGVKQRVFCDVTRKSSGEALEDAEKLVNNLRTERWVIAVSDRDA